EADPGRSGQSDAAGESGEVGSSGAEPSTDTRTLEEHSADAARAEREHPGPFFWVKRSSAGVYDKPTTNRSGKVGYIKRGGKVAILEGKLEAPGCPGGWYRVLSGGVICSQVGTTNEKDPIAKFSPRQPDIAEI